MQAIEREIIRRFPDWFDGPKGRIGKALVRGYGKFCRFGEIERFLAEHGHLKGHLLVGQALEYLDIRYAVDQVEKTYIPASGRCIVVANHPAGIVDALALLHLVGSVRGDVRILANKALTSLGLLDELLIPVDVFGAGPRRFLARAWRTTGGLGGLGGWVGRQPGLAGCRRCCMRFGFDSWRRNIGAGLLHFGARTASGRGRLGGIAGRRGGRLVGVHGVSAGAEDGTDVPAAPAGVAGAGSGRGSAAGSVSSPAAPMASADAGAGSAGSAGSAPASFCACGVSARTSANDSASCACCAAFCFARSH